MLRGVKQKLHMGSYGLQYAQLCVLFAAGAVNAAVATEGVDAYRHFLWQLIAVPNEVPRPELML